jgi:hypothetical protein
VLSVKRTGAEVLGVSSRARLAPATGASASSCRAAAAAAATGAAAATAAFAAVSRPASTSAASSGSVSSAGPSIVCTFSAGEECREAATLKSKTGTLRDRASSRAICVTVTVNDVPTKIIASAADNHCCTALNL